ncbi:MAG: hypothetical protein HY078_14465 [Elusimicrobia bacterium]|nr:hypothetical protein [Elusimicrobiota bacterium]
METIRARGLVTGPAWAFALWGAVVSIKSFYDLFVGEPEANLYAPTKWAFVTREQWMRYAGFELTYGIAAIAIGVFLMRYAKFVPETIRRRRQEPDLKLFP